VWDYHNGRRLKLLEDPSKKLEDVQIIYDQQMLLEEQG